MVVVSVGLQRLPTLGPTPQCMHKTQLSARIENQRAVAWSLESSRPLLPAGILFCPILPDQTALLGQIRTNCGEQTPVGICRGKTKLLLPFALQGTMLRGASAGSFSLRIWHSLARFWKTRVWQGSSCICMGHGTTAIWIRAITEPLLPGARVGPLLACLENQFWRAQDGDR